MSRPPIAVLGLGGVGGMILARTGGIGVGTPRTVKAIRESGLTLVDAHGTSVVHPESVERLSVPVSLLVIAVKATALAEALSRVDSEALVEAVVLPLLNGLENVDRLRDLLDHSAVAAGSIGRTEVFSPEPGMVVQRTEAALVSAGCRDLDRGDLESALAPLRVPGIEVSVTGDERAVLWEKAARLAVLAAATTASGQPVGLLRSDPAWRVRLAAALDEAVATAAADGVRLDPTAQWAIIDAMPETSTTSTARDVAAGRPSELDAITGSVVRAGRRHGVATPELERLLEDACRPR